MFGVNTNDICSQYEEFRIKVKDNKSFGVTGLTSFLRLFLLSNIEKYSDKKLLFITSTEQNALKYQSDLKTICDLDSQIIP
ncbi:hypothetical protein IJ596_02685, partial [bacterium]|nr:hypothetical protein [bacterium]